MAFCTTSYTPQPAVAAIHQIPHTNISFQETPDTVSGTLEYFEAVIIWSCLPILVGVIVFILLMVYNCLVCCCCCSDEIYETKKKAKWCAGLGIMWMVVGILFIAGSLYIEVELNRNVEKLTGFIQQAQTSQDNAQRLSESISQTDFSIAVNQLIARSSQNQNVRNEAGVLMSLGDGLISNLTLVGMHSRQYQLKPSSDQLPVAETARHWSVMGYLIALTLVFIIVTISFLCMKVHFVLCTLVLTTFFMVMVWLLVALGFAGTIVLADFCYDPESTLKSTQDPSLHDQLDYYLVCSPGCNNSYSMIDMTLDQAYVDIGGSIDYIDSQLQPSDVEARDHFEDIVQMMTTSNETYKLARGAFTCSNTNEMFVDARNSLCGPGFIYMLALFCAMFGLSVIILLVLCKGTAFFGFLRATEDEGLYDFTLKTDTFVPKNFDGDYASSTWTRPQPAMLGGNMTDAGTSTVVEVEPNGQNTEGHELQQFDTLNSTEPPSYRETYEEVEVSSQLIPQVEHAVFDDV